LAQAGLAPEIVNVATLRVLAVHLPLRAAMGRAVALAAVVVLSQIVQTSAAILELRPQSRRAFLAVNSTRGGVPPAFGGPQQNPATINLQGFCRRVDCKPGDDCEPVCTEQPCCCWSTFAAEIHPAYPAPDETANKQECLFAPEGFTYAPEPGLTFDDGYVAALKKANLPTFDGRRLCCLRRSDGVQDDSQRDLRFAVKTSTTTIAMFGTTTAAIPDPDEVDPMFTTQIVTTSLMNPGDEYENAQMEEAARKHLAAANDLSAAVGALNSSAMAIEEIDDKMQTDPNLVRSRKHVAQMRAAIRGWAERRWANLERLKTGDASAFDDAPAGPPALK